MGKVGNVETISIPTESCTCEIKIFRQISATNREFSLRSYELFSLRLCPDRCDRFHGSRCEWRGENGNNRKPGSMVVTGVVRCVVERRVSGHNGNVRVNWVVDGEWRIRSGTVRYWSVSDDRSVVYRSRSDDWGVRVVRSVVCYEKMIRKYKTPALCRY